MTHAEVSELMGEVQIAPGVHGQMFDTPNGIYIPVISADNPGSGDVGRFLDGLPMDRDIKFPCVLSPTLRGMLLRRGYVNAGEFSEEFGENVDVMVRRGNSNG